MATLIRHIELVPTTKLWFKGNDFDATKQWIGGNDFWIKHRGD